MFIFNHKVHKFTICEDLSKFVDVNFRKKLKPEAKTHLIQRAAAPSCVYDL